MWLVLAVVLLGLLVGSFFLYLHHEHTEKMAQYACVHKWKQVSKDPITRPIDDKRKEITIGFFVVLECEKCHDIKSKSLTLSGDKEEHAK